MEQSVLALLIRHINEEHQAVSDALSSGSAKDYAEYRELCGRITGLARSKYIIEEMRIRLKEQDD